MTDPATSPAAARSVSPGAGVASLAPKPSTEAPALPLLHTMLRRHGRDGLLPSVRRLLAERPELRRGGRRP